MGRTGFQMVVLISGTSLSSPLFFWAQLSLVDVNGSCLHGGRPSGFDHWSLHRVLEKSTQPPSRMGLRLLGQLNPLQTVSWVLVKKTNTKPKSSLKIKY